MTSTRTPSARFNAAVEEYRALQGSRFRIDEGSELREEWGDPGDDSLRSHYFWQDLWAAREVLKDSPRLHVDIGSRVDGFIAHLLADGWLPVDFCDLRPLMVEVPGLSGRFWPVVIPGLTVRVCDASRHLPYPDASLSSLSSLHALEHFGLGRYGDTIDPAAWERGAREMMRVLAPGGRLYLGVPVGRERVQFNAHRIFDPSTILEAFSGLSLVRFGLVDDAGRYHERAPVGSASGLRYGCGLFEFVKGAL